MNCYTQNLLIINEFITRNREKILNIHDEIFWMNDVAQEMKISKAKEDEWLKVENLTGQTISFFPIDGNAGVFRRAGLDVRDVSRFEYLPSPRETQNKTAGPCDCLILDHRWRFFEFKNAPEAGRGEPAASVLRDKAEKQIARTMTYFREKANEKGISKIDAIFEGVIVVNPYIFPATSASLIDRGKEFFLDFQARLIEIRTDDTYKILSSISSPTKVPPSMTLAKGRVRRKVVQRRLVKNRQKR